MAFARVVLGILFGMRGWDKVFNMTPSVHASQFFTGPYADSWIPQWMLWTAGMTIPFVELIAGWLLVVGWRTRESLISLGLVLILVTYGQTLGSRQSDEMAVFVRLVLVVFVAMVPRNVDRFSADYWVARFKWANRNGRTMPP